MTATLPETPFDFPVIEGEAGWVALGDQMLRQLDDVQKERQANAAAEKTELERIHNAYLDLDGSLARREARLLENLARVADALKPYLRGKKSRRLAFGSLGWREQKPRLEVEDEKAAMAWAKLKAPQIIEQRTTERIVKVELDAVSMILGVVPDGCTLIPGGPKFYAKPEASAPDTE